jgi:hypothetical protein
MICAKNKNVDTEFSAHDTFQFSAHDTFLDWKDN